jgi:hypothetical protein
MLDVPGDRLLQDRSTCCPPPVDHKISIDEVTTELKRAGYATFMVEVALLPYQYILRAR